MREPYNSLSLIHSLSLSHTHTHAHYLSLSLSPSPPPPRSQYTTRGAKPWPIRRITTQELPTLYPQTLHPDNWFQNVCVCLNLVLQLWSSVVQTTLRPGSWPSVSLATWRYRNWKDCCKEFTKWPRPSRGCPTWTELYVISGFIIILLCPHTHTHTHARTHCRGT